MLDEDLIASTEVRQKQVLDREQLENCISQMRAKVPNWSVKL
jgi:hypothetical protein